MIKIISISQDYLKSILNYDEDTGLFTWKIRPIDHFKTKRSFSIWNVKNSGKIAGWIDEYGYRRISIDGRNYRAHRLAYLYVYGLNPKEIDHIDVHGSKSDNRIKNLRAATSAQNRQNRGIRRDNKYGIKGISFHKKIGKWYAEIQSNNERFYLGCFASKDEAIKAYNEAIQQHHKEFSRIE
jgi:hypothetical protein